MELEKRTITPKICLNIQKYKVFLLAGHNLPYYTLLCITAAFLIVCIYSVYIYGLKKV